MTRFSYIFRKHPSFRLLTIAIFVLAGLLLLLLSTHKISRKPVLNAISPNIGMPGDLMIIRGDFFGNERSSSYVEICGNRLTGSSYISWTNDEIRLIIPANVEDGLVYVVTHGGKSNPEFFANESAIPVSAPQNPMLSVPTISEITPSNPFPGQLITISGKNFGSTRENSAVYFSSRLQNETRENPTDFNSLDSRAAKDSQKNAYVSLGSKFQDFILPCDDDFDYEYWSETEIRVRVPSRAQDGSVFVATDNGQSTMQPLAIKRRVGEKSFNTKHTYLLQVESNISKVKGKGGAIITLHLPHPAFYSQQDEISITETIPSPTLLNYKNTSIFQFEIDNSGKNNFSAKQTFVIECSSAETTVYRDYVHAFNEKNRMLYRTYTRADELIPSDTDEILELLPKIILNVTNPYRRAEMIFEYMVANFKLHENTRTPTSNPLDLIKRKRGDTYDFAVIYTALLRSAGIPARMLSGILVNADKRTQNHWWCEFYIEDFGWVPVDIALGAGLQFEPFLNERHPPRYYFGNIDAQHIAFSLNYNIVKPSALNNKVVYIPRSYAQQSVWEESSNDVDSYSSYWATPTVIGIY